jgi:hypothetical protein
MWAPQPTHRVGTPTLYQLGGHPNRTPLAVAARAPPSQVTGQAWARARVWTGAAQWSDWCGVPRIITFQHCCSGGQPFIDADDSCRACHAQADDRCRALVDDSCRALVDDSCHAPADDSCRAPGKVAKCELPTAPQRSTVPQLQCSVTGRGRWHVLVTCPARRTVRQY